jgi:hypothetical protein
MGFGLEAATGFEPVNDGFADRCLTTWLRRLGGATNNRLGAAGGQRLPAPSPSWGLTAGGRERTVGPVPLGVPGEIPAEKKPSNLNWIIPA